MGIKTVDKNCKKCGIFMVDVDASKLYCDICFKQNKKDSYEKFKSKAKIENKEIKNNTKIEYKNHFKQIIKKPYHLTTTGFNEISKLKVKSYCQIFECTWTEIIKMFGFYEIYYGYIKEEYKIYFNKTKLRGLEQFCRQHQYIKKDVLFQLDLDKLKKDCHIQKYRYTNKQYKENFLNLKNNLGRVPLYNEFVLHSNITIEAYALKYNLKNIVYDEVTKMFSTNDEYISYKQMADINQFETLLLNKVANILDTYFIPQATFDWLLNEKGYALSVDGFFEEYNLMVEADGQQHRIPMGYFGGEEKLKRQINNDNIKNKLIKKNGYKILRIYIKSDWYDEDYLVERLQEMGIKIPNQQTA